MNYTEAQEAIKEARSTINASRNIIRELLSEVAIEIDNLNWYSFQNIEDLKTIKKKLRKFNARDGKWIKD
jgi:hypothetical protein